MTIYQQIRLTRKAKGLTQTDLARAIGCSQTTISDMERGYLLSAHRFIPAAVAALELSVNLPPQGQP